MNQLRSSTMAGCRCTFSEDEIMSVVNGASLVCRTDCRSAGCRGHRVLLKWWWCVRRRSRRVSPSRTNFMSLDCCTLHNFTLRYTVFRVMIDARRPTHNRITSHVTSCQLDVMSQHLPLLLIRDQENIWMKLLNLIVPALYFYFTLLLFVRHIFLHLEAYCELKKGLPVYHM